MTMRRSFRSVATLVATAALAVPSVALAGSAAAHGSPPTPGAAGIGDKLYPTLGNGGYDALHYDLNLRYATSAPSQGIDGTMTMAARATQSLSRFDLDFSGAGVGSVVVNGRPARFSRVGEDLVITPSRPIWKGQLFVVQVRHFTANPTVADPDQLLSTAFFITPDGSATSGQPNAMHAVYPSNDHPRDKASFTFRFDVPAGTTAVANGDLIGKYTRAGRSYWTYLQRQPMATELTQLAVGAFTVIPRGKVDGVAVRDVVPTRLVATYKPLLGVEKDQLTWMRERVGRYPFDLYGSLVVDTHLGFALETQTLSIFDTPWFTDYPRGVWDPVMLHELSHQWFGDSVAPWEWSDVWLNEGHATWYELTYAEQKGMLEDDLGFATLDEGMQVIYSLGDTYRQRYGPVAQPKSGDVYDVFSNQVYYGGALVLYALRQRVGDATFQRIERAWVGAYRGRSASTQDFIALASRVSHQDLRSFLTDWLYGTTTPPMPGHPDWVVDPPAAAAATLAAKPGATLRDLRVR
jgi:aminopeptidase N